LPTDPVDLKTVQFSQTTIYYWPQFGQNATSGQNSYLTINGPFQFGDGVQLTKKRKEVLG
jgi:hypothetical protein